MDDPIPLLHDHLIGAARRLPDKIALVCQRKRLSYGELDEQSNALAHTLVRSGIQPGDRVAIVANASAEVAMAFWAILKANAVAAVMHGAAAGAELAAKLEDCGAKAMIVDGHASSPSHLQLGTSSRVETLIGPARLKQVLPSISSWEEALATGRRAHPPKRQAIDLDLAVLLYGPGPPHGIMLTHRAMMSGASSMIASLGMEEDDVVLDAPGRSVDRSLYDMVAAFRSGARLVLVPPFISRAQLLRTILEEHVTGLPVTPAVLSVLTDVKDPARLELTRLRFVSSSGAPVTAEALAHLRRVVPQANIYSMFGPIECTCCTYLPPEIIDRKPTSVGAAVPNLDVWLVDGDGTRLGPGQCGELAVRGASLAAGYWEKAAETARRLRPASQAGDLVFFSGQRFEMDEEGHLHPCRTEKP
ncbi:MAG: class I adenylate-forming enzyme family protein [Myxococcota bacterium]